VYGHDFFGWLVRDHKTTTIAAIFLSALAFLPWIVPKPKHINKRGGEEPMNKFHAVIVGVISVLTVLVVSLAFYTDEAKAVLGGMGGGIGQAVVDTFSTFNGYLSGFEPYQVLSVGGIGGILFTVFMANWLWPRIKRKQKQMEVHGEVGPMQDRITPSIPTQVKKASVEEVETT